MSRELLAVAPRLGVSSLSAAIALGLLALTAPGCSNSMPQDSDVQQGPAPSAGEPPGDPIKPNTKTSRPPFKVEPT